MIPNHQCMDCGWSWYVPLRYCDAKGLECTACGSACVWPDDVEIDSETYYELIAGGRITPCSDRPRERSAS